MNQTLMDLKNLQEVDDLTRLDKQALEEGAARTAEADTKLRTAESRLTLGRDDLAAMNTRHRALEAEVADLSQRQKKNDQRQMSAKNDNEFNALQKEAEFLAQRVNELEDEILDLLDRLEKRELEIKDLEVLAGEERGACQAVHEAVEKNAEQAKARLAQLVERRRLLVEAIPQDRMRQYEELAKMRANRSVTAASDGLCLACRLGFPPQIYNDLQRNEKILTCPNCGRIIYWREHPDFKEAEEAGS